MNNKNQFHFLLFTFSFILYPFPLSLLFAENHMDLMRELVGEHRDSRFWIIQQHLWI